MICTPYRIRTRAKWFGIIHATVTPMTHFYRDPDGIRTHTRNVRSVLHFHLCYGTSYPIIVLGEREFLFPGNRKLNCDYAAIAKLSFALNTNLLLFTFSIVKSSHPRNAGDELNLVNRLLIFSLQMMGKLVEMESFELSSNKMLIIINDLYLYS